MHNSSWWHLQIQLGQAALAQDSFCNETNHVESPVKHILLFTRELVAVANMYLPQKYTIGCSVKFSPVEGLDRNHVCVCKGKISSKGGGPT